MSSIASRRKRVLVDPDEASALNDRTQARASQTITAIEAAKRYCSIATDKFELAKSMQREARAKNEEDTQRAKTLAELYEMAKNSLEVAESACRSSEAAIERANAEVDEAAQQQKEASEFLRLLEISTAPEVVDIDCTNDANVSSLYREDCPKPAPESSRSRSSVAFVALSNQSKRQKINSRRVFVHGAGISHVNGTYVQEGTYDNAPIFVRVVPPRKFMGKECAIVLRRNDRQAWRVGLVPAHRVTHPRSICYYYVSVPADELDEDVPPTQGWRVYNGSPSAKIVYSSMSICLD